MLTLHKGRLTGGVHVCDEPAVKSSTVGEVTWPVFGSIGAGAAGLMLQQTAFYSSDTEIKLCLISKKVQQWVKHI